MRICDGPNISWRRAAAGALLAVALWAMPAAAQQDAGPEAAGAVQVADPAAAPAANGVMPTLGDLIDLVDKSSGNGEDESARAWSEPVKMALVFAGLAILPSLVVMVTSFTRIVIVLSFVRRALTTQTIPPTMAIVGLSLFLTLFTMAPTLTEINTTALQPYLGDEITFEEATAESTHVLKRFILRQTRRSDLEVFAGIAGMEEMPTTADEVPSHVAIPAFAISEFRTAFEMGCLLFIPFLLVDLVVAGVLLATGMMMLPPAIISMPLKIILFVLVDGWGMLARTLVTSFR